MRIESSGSNETGDNIPVEHASGTSSQLPRVASKDVQ